MNIVSLIPARLGSKRIPRKNIKLLGNYPLLAYSIITSRLSTSIKRTIVSTDSSLIAHIASMYDPEIPFLRPKEISRDSSTDLEVISHTIDWLEGVEGSIPELLVYLRPSTPLRDPVEIIKAIEYFRANCSPATSLRSAHKMSDPVHKMFQIKNGYFKGFFPDDPRAEYHNLPSQLLPQSYHPNGYIDIVTPDLIRKTGLLWGDKILAFITDPVIEIDIQENFDYLEYYLKKHGHWSLAFLKQNYPEVGDDI